MTVWDRLPESTRRELDRISGALNVIFNVKCNKDGKPYCAVIDERCPLCVENIWDKDDEREIRKRSAYLLLPSLEYRCHRPECPAGGDIRGCTGSPGRKGLPYAEWKTYFRDLRDDPGPATPASISPSARAEERAAAAALTTPTGPATLVEETGRFFNLDGVVVFVRKAGGEPLHVTSKAFASHVNHVLRERKLSMARSRDALEEIIEHAHLHGTRAQLEYVTGRAENGAPLIHFGGGFVIRWEGGRFSAATNGTEGVVFFTEQDFLPLTVEKLRSGKRANPERFPALHAAVLDHLPPITGLLTAEEARALLLAMWLATFLRPWAIARPIVLLVGPPGCGKTTTQRLFVVIYYGPDGEVGGGAALDRVSKDLLAGAVYQSFVVRDDVTDLPPGGIDSLCRTATGTKAKLSAFHQTLELVSFRARAQLLLSAVNPSWLTRADLVSRLWLIQFDSPTKNSTITERDRVERALALRPAIWMETAKALEMLASPLPPRKALSRFDSFEQAVFPIIQRAGYGPAFESALRKMPAIAAAIAARSDPLLGYTLALAHSVQGRWLSATELADELARTLGIQGHARDPHLAPGLARDPLRLAQLLGKLERDSSAVVAVESRLGHDNKKIWRLTPRIAGDGGVGGVDPDLTSSRSKEQDLSDSSTTTAAGTPPTPPHSDLVT
jgi:hypothetical protein